MDIANKLPYMALLVVLLSTSCSSGETGDKQETFKNEVSLTADSVEMDVVLKAGNIYRADPYVIVSDVEHAEGKHFAVFDDNLKYLYSFCDYGSGPEECVMASMIKNMPQNQILVRDHANDRFHSYVLSDSGAVHIGSFKVEESGPYESIWEGNYVSEDKYLIKSVSPRRTVRRLVDLRTNTVYDSINATFDLQAKMGKDYYSEFDDFWMIVNDDKFVCAYYFIDRIEMGHIDGEKLEMVCYRGAGTPPDFYPYTDEKLTGKYKYNVDYNIVYYEWLFGSDKRAYTSYFGRPWGDIDEHSQIIEVYSYSGEPLMKCNLNVPVKSFIVFDDKRIIGINPDRCDDHFYCFDID